MWWVPWVLSFLRAGAVSCVSLHSHYLVHGRGSQKCVRWVVFSFFKHLVGHFMFLIFALEDIVIVGRIDVHVPILGTCDCVTWRGTRGFADATKHHEMREDLVLSGWARRHPQVPVRERRQEGQPGRRRCNNGSKRWEWWQEGPRAKSGLQSCKRIHLCCFKPLSVW